MSEAKHPRIEPTPEEKHWADTLTLAEVADLIAAAREMSDAVLDHFAQEGYDGVRPGPRILEALDRLDLAMGIDLDDDDDSVEDEDDG